MFKYDLYSMQIMFSLFQHTLLAIELIANWQYTNIILGPLDVLIFQR